MKKNEFVKSLNVSRETLNGFYEYKSLLSKWNKKINLISKHTLVDIWERHFLDSYQILKLIGNKKRILDIGSGAGFPAIVCAICSNNNFDLVEINQKK